MMRLHAVVTVLMLTKHEVYARTRLLLSGLRAVVVVFDAYEVPGIFLHAVAAVLFWLHAVVTVLMEAC